MILDAILQIMYEKIEKTKAQYPNSPELQSLLDYTGFVSAGWIFVHIAVTPRYLEAPYQVVLEEIEEKYTIIQKIACEKDSNVQNGFLFLAKFSIISCDSFNRGGVEKKHSRSLSGNANQFCRWILTQPLRDGPIRPERRFPSNASYVNQFAFV